MPKGQLLFWSNLGQTGKKHLVSNNFCAPIFVLLFLYFKSLGQMSHVRCAVVTRLPASEKLVPSTLREINKVSFSNSRSVRTTFVLTLGSHLNPWLHRNTPWWKQLKHCFLLLVMMVTLQRLNLLEEKLPALMKYLETTKNIHVSLH